MSKLGRGEECRKDLYSRQPVYYCTGPDGAVYYANTIHGLLEESGLKKEFNQNMVQTYLRYWYPASEDTFYQGVKRLMPGHRLFLRHGKPHTKPFENVEFSENPFEDYDEAVSHLKGLLADIFEEERAHCSASFLSSGVDSSLLAASLKADQVITVGYDESRYDESHEAAAIAETLGTTIHTALIRIEDYFAVVEEAMLAREEPTGDSSYIPLYLAAKEAAKHTDACCSGEGPDELFCGYRPYQTYLDSPKPDYWVISHTCMKTPRLKEAKRFLAPYNDGFQKMQAFDLFYATECNLLPNLHAASRGNGIDIRTPFVDRRLFDFAVSIPPQYKVNTENNKLVFRDAAEAFLPQTIAQKPKRAFPVPTQAWMHTEPWAGKIQSAFERPEAKTLLGGFIPRYYLKKYFSESIDREAGSSYWHPVWTMFALLEWYRCEFGGTQ